MGSNAQLAKAGQGNLVLVYDISLSIDLCMQD